MTPPCPPYRTILIALQPSLRYCGVSLPSEREKITLYERDGETSAAVFQIDHIFQPESETIILDAALRLHLRAGDVESALAVASTDSNVASGQPCCADHSHEHASRQRLTVTQRWLSKCIIAGKTRRH